MPGRLDLVLWISWKGEREEADVFPINAWAQSMWLLSQRQSCLLRCHIDRKPVTQNNETHIQILMFVNLALFDERCFTFTLTNHLTPLKMLNVH